MITTTTKCDICGCEYTPTNGLNSAPTSTVRISLGYVYATYPPKDPGHFDLCAGCTNMLRRWIRDTKEKMGK